MNIRKAAEGDINALVLMRWEFTLEHQPGVSDDFEFIHDERLHGPGVSVERNRKPTSTSDSRVGCGKQV